MFALFPVPSFIILIILPEFLTQEVCEKQPAQTCTTHDAFADQQAHQGGDPHVRPLPRCLLTLILLPVFSHAGGLLRKAREAIRRRVFWRQTGFQFAETTLSASTSWPSFSFCDFLDGFLADFFADFFADDFLAAFLAFLAAFSSASLLRDSLGGLPDLLHRCLGASWSRRRRYSSRPSSVQNRFLVVHIVPSVVNAATIAGFTDV